MFRRIAIVTAALICATAVPATASAACRNAKLQPTAASVAKAERAVVCLLNVHRARRGLPKLRVNRKLSRAASAHSSDMRRRRFFDHVSPAGTTPQVRIRRTGYLARASRYRISENIAWGAMHFSTPASTVRRWMKSSGHRANILNRRFRDVGIGVAMGTPGARRLGGAIYTTTFGTRRS